MRLGGENGFNNAYQLLRLVPGASSPVPSVLVQVVGREQPTRETGSGRRHNRLLWQCVFVSLDSLKTPISILQFPLFAEDLNRMLK